MSSLGNYFKQGSRKPPLTPEINESSLQKKIREFLISEKFSYSAIHKGVRDGQNFTAVELDDGLTFIVLESVGSYYAAPQPILALLESFNEDFTGSHGEEMLLSISTEKDALRSEVISYEVTLRKGIEAFYNLRNPLMADLRFVEWEPLTVLIRKEAVDITLAALMEALDVP